MGSYISSPENDGPRVASYGWRQLQPTSIDAEENAGSKELIWHTEKSWYQWLLHMEKLSIEQGDHDEFISRYNDLVFVGARMYLEKRYPDSPAMRTIRDIETQDTLFVDETTVLAAKLFLIMDAYNDRISHALVLIVAKPPRLPAGARIRDAGNIGLWTTLGAELDSVEMRIAKHFVADRMIAEQSPTLNQSHMLLHVFVGADLVTCRVDPTPKVPTIKFSSTDLRRVILDEPRELMKRANTEPLQHWGVFDPFWFCIAVHRIEEMYPGATIWD